MENKEVKVILKPGHEVILKSDAPDIGALVSAIVQIRDQFDPSELRVECEHDGFDKASFKEIIIEATSAFIDEIRLDRAAYDAAIATLQDTPKASS